MSIVQTQTQQKVKQAQSSHGNSQRKARLRRSLKENAIGYLFMLPWFIGLIALTLGPMLGSLYLFPLPAMICSQLHNGSESATLLRCSPIYAFWIL